eukprot:13996260-Alexandrium_andersonii.AAC.1
MHCTKDSCNSRPTLEAMSLQGLPEACISAHGFPEACLPWPEHRYLPVRNHSGVRAAPMGARQR